ncbi:Methyltransferase FkbM [Seminavis robusta]|uniref:Methyltransferase FkbM n=1 Tax=Seminavis robusta TaxID=568900 RepID=A0A9N8EJ54_9STRA|nr:Methyltransferase FkbM [Seminavis robusta]|eukprot:Sro1263_g257200.1 Methyltransferase FkbM (358) ;mRNA; f:10452-11525
MMMDSSLKRKLENDGMSPKIHKNSMLHAARVMFHKVSTDFKQNPKLQNDVKVASIGLLVGIIIGGLLAKTNEGGPSYMSLSRGSVPWTSLKAPGWNPIHIFYGKMDNFYNEIPDKWYLKHSPKHTTSNSNEWFGQHGQDVAVAKFFNFKSNGYFVDLASNDAVWASNTFALEQNFDWKGICIEANPIYWYRLSFRTGCHVVGSIVGGKDFEGITVSLPTDPKKSGPFGGIVGKDFDNKKAKEPEARFTASLTSILKKFGAPKVIDYLSLDVEGAEEFIMKDFPFHQPYTFRVISIERPKSLLMKKLEDAGYKQVLDFKRGDTLWAHSSVYEAGKKRVEDKGHEIAKHKLDDWPQVRR